MEDSTKCPHCLDGFYSYWEAAAPGADARGHGFSLLHQNCPLCGNKIVVLRKYQVLKSDNNRYLPIATTVTDQYVYPRAVLKFRLWAGTERYAPTARGAGQRRDGGWNEPF